jgi:hypothetical protein
MTGTNLAHDRGIRNLSSEGLCVVCESEHLRLGLCISLEFIPDIFGASGKADFSTSQDHPLLRMPMLRSK